METVIATLLAKPRKKFEDVDYFVGFHHLVESLRRHNASLPPIVVLSPDIKTIPPGADHLVRIDQQDYLGIENVQAAFGKSVYFKLGVFRLPAKRVVFFDSDVLTLAPVEKLWSPQHFCEYPLWGIRESASLGLTHPDWQGRLNAGVLVINERFLGKQRFDALINIARRGDSYDLGDQGVLNAYLNQNELWSEVGELDPSYNMPCCVRTDGDWEALKSDIKAMHYLGPRKPWRTAPKHSWHHADTQALWDREVEHHNPLPRRGRPDLSSSIHTRIVRWVQKYERWRDSNLE